MIQTYLIFHLRTPFENQVFANIQKRNGYNNNNDDDDNNNNNGHQLFLETSNGNIRSSGKQSIPKAEEGYCKEATQSTPLTHSESHQAQATVENT